MENLHLDTLPLETKNAFLRCIELPLFKANGWYLAGGTALALQAGHRKSVDLDFFTTEKTFNEEGVAGLIAEAGQWETTSISPGTVYGEFLGAKMSLIAYPYFTPADPMLHAGNVSIIAPGDIAVMKIAAISQRGRKRDFYDLYWLSLNVLPLSHAIERLDRQYSLRQNMSHVLKSLVYFEDAESDPDPDIRFEATWKDVKTYFKKQVPGIVEGLMKL